MPRSRTLATAALFTAVLLIALPCASGAVTANGRLQIIQLDVGQGDGALLISPLGQVVLIDEGPSGVTPAMGRTVVQQLQDLGVTHVTYHFASHYHSDHIGNLPAIKAAGITVDYGWDRGGSYTTGAYGNYVNALGATRRTMVKDQVITLDSLSAHPVTIKCVNLSGAGLYSGTEENVLSMVLKVSYGEFDEVFGGDLSGYNSGSYRDIETTVGPQVGPVEVYKIHHHGSATSTNPSWLAAVQAKIGVVSEGNGNSYGHPTAAAMSRLHTAGVHTYWTETGTGATPLAGWDKVSNGQVIIEATWEPGGVDTVRGNGFTDTFTNSGTPGDSQPPLVAVTSPNGGENWKAGSTQAVTWTASDNVGVTSVDLAYSTDGGATYPNPIAAGLANSGTYFWTVPNAPGTALKVRATARDAAGNSAADAGDGNFTISTWTIVASAGPGGTIAPSGSIPVVEGASQGFTVGASAGYHIADVTVDGSSVGAVPSYAFTGVSADHAIAAAFAADQFTLAVTTVGGGAVARSPDESGYPYGQPVLLTATPGAGWAFSGWSGGATGTADTVTVVMDASKSVTATFRDAAAPVVTVTSPVGGEQWEVGNDEDLTWTATDNVGVDSVTVEYSMTGPAGPWLEIAHGLANTGDYAWTLPGELTDSALVRVTAYDAAGNAGTDQSDSTFHLVSGQPVSAGAGPHVLALARPLPNPSAGAVQLRFSLPAAGRARVEIVDLSGRRVWSRQEELAAGAHAWAWDGRSAGGAPARAGLYFLRLATPWGSRSERLVRLTSR